MQWPAFEWWINLLNSHQHLNTICLWYHNAYICLFKFLRKKSVNASTNMLQQWDSKILNNIKTALKNLYIFCTQNIFSLAFTKIRYLKKWRSLLIKYLTENSPQKTLTNTKLIWIRHIRFFTSTNGLTNPPSLSHLHM